MGSPQTGGWPQLQKVCSRSEVSEPHAGLFCTGKTRPQTIWCWRSASLTFGRLWGLWQIVSTLKRCTQNLTRSGIQSRSSYLKDVWVRPTADPGEPLREARGNWNSPWGHRHWQQLFCGACSTTSAILEPSLWLTGARTRPCPPACEHSIGMPSPPACEHSAGMPCPPACEHQCWDALPTSLWAPVLGCPAHSLWAPVLGCLRPSS